LTYPPRHGEERSDEAIQSFREKFKKDWIAAAASRPRNDEFRESRATGLGITPRYARLTHPTSRAAAVGGGACCWNEPWPRVKKVFWFFFSKKNRFL
jgi:hypothetical protein